MTVIIYLKSVKHVNDVMSTTMSQMTLPRDFTNKYNCCHQQCLMSVVFAWFKIVGKDGTGQ